jgi:hypothetical protein
MQVPVSNSSARAACFRQCRRKLLRQALQLKGAWLEPPCDESAPLLGRIDVIPQHHLSSLSAPTLSLQQAQQLTLA